MPFLGRSCASSLGGNRPKGAFPSPGGLRGRPSAFGATEGGANTRKARPHSGPRPSKGRGHSGPFPFSAVILLQRYRKPPGLRGLALGKRGKARLLHLVPGGRVPHRFKIADDRRLADPPEIPCRRWPIPVLHVQTERGGKRGAVLLAAPCSREGQQPAWAETKTR